MNDQTIQLVAQAIQTNTELLLALFKSLPRETQEHVVRETNVTQQQAPVQPAPVAAPVAPVAPPQTFNVPVMVAQPAPAMPAPPVFTPPPAPAPAPAPIQAPGVPFTDGAGLIKYTMDAYQTMGAAKGAKIQGILQSLGAANINDVRADQYPQFYAQVEALKVAA
jgi:hypothetical protein